MTITESGLVVSGFKARNVTQRYNVDEFDPKGHTLCIQDTKLGDERIEWDPNNEETLVTAREKFDAKIKEGWMGYTVALETVEKRGEQIKEFDPTASAIVMTPPMKGG